MYTYIYSLYKYTYISYRNVVYLASPLNPRASDSSCEVFAMGNDIRDHRIDAQPITNTSSEEMTKWDENVDKAILRQFGFWIFEIQNLNAGIFFLAL